ncbi:hypothetical protein Pyn_24435 [Prunus yedoensis var. nudiflora]|uniref:DUF8039 domain-containing protein n=1 Tax=Prunus yedoensis var. nudiflora TaxID=2094558 RepID=A0A315AUB7_PRUYE|nr:hypothetical protein Pyn_24435 [Prunus yedoensis var. nudiflora]
METRKMMEEQQKRHEAAQQALQNQIEMLKVVINTQVPNNTSLQSPNIHPSPILSEKASTNIERKLEEGEKEICGEEGCEDVVEQTESEFMKGKECKMAFGEKANLVASGTIVEINVPNQMVHNVPLGKGNIRVAVNYALQGDSPLPIPVKGVLETVEDAIGSQVAWPQDLIVFDDKVKKRETTKEKLAKTLFKSISPTMPKSCKVLYAYAHQVMSKGQTISTNIDEDIFGVKKMVYIFQEQVIAFAEMREIGQAIITAYISYLFRLVKSQQRDQVIGFMDPARTAHDPRDGNLRSEYITKCLKQTSIDSIFLIPFNPGGIKAFNAQIGRRPRKLPMWIMLSYRARRKDTYTQMELDEVREELASHVLEWLFD